MHFTFFSFYSDFGFDVVGILSRSYTTGTTESVCTVCDRGKEQERLRETARDNAVGVESCRMCA